MNTTKKLKQYSKTHPPSQRKPSFMQFTFRNQRLHARQTNLFSFNSLCNYFNVPLSVAAKTLGVSSSHLKNGCRRVGIAKWPYRKLGRIVNELVTMCDSIREEENPIFKQGLVDKKNEFLKSSIDSCCTECFKFEPNSEQRHTLYKTLVKHLSDVSPNSMSVIGKVEELGLSPSNSSSSSSSPNQVKQDQCQQEQQKSHQSSTAVLQNDIHNNCQTDNRNTNTDLNEKLINHNLSENERNIIKYENNNNSHTDYNDNKSLDNSSQLSSISALNNASNHSFLDEDEGTRDSFAPFIINANSNSQFSIENQNETDNNNNNNNNNNRNDNNHFISDNNNNYSKSTNNPRSHSFDTPLTPPFSSHNQNPPTTTTKTTSTIINSIPSLSKGSPNQQHYHQQQQQQQNTSTGETKQMFGHHFADGSLKDEETSNYNSSSHKELETLSKSENTSGSLLPLPPSSSSISRWSFASNDIFQDDLDNSSFSGLSPLPKMSNSKHKGPSSSRHPYFSSRAALDKVSIDSLTSNEESNWTFNGAGGDSTWSINSTSNDGHPFPSLATSD